LIQEADRVRRDARIRCDVCIIGAGAAGITLAAELAEGSDLSVVLLESGGKLKDPDTQDLYRGELRGAPQYPLDASRLRFLGGTTNHWGGMCRPFDPLDFRQRAWVPHSGWPLGREELDPFYERAHAVCDLGPYDYGQDAASAAWPGVTERGARLAEEEDLEIKLVQRSKPTRWAKKYSDLLAGPDGPRVILHANAYQIVPDPTGSRVEEVDVRTLQGNRFHVSAKNYVLATGGVENARLLLLSDSVVPGGLGNRRDLVGRFFMDHPGATPFGVVLFFDRAYERLAVEEKHAGVGVFTGIGMSAAMQERERLLANAAYMYRPMDVPTLAELRWLEHPKVLDPPDLRMLEFLQALDPGRGDAKGSICWIRSEQAPNPESRVTLGSELDALGQRRVVLDWQLGELSQRTFHRAARFYAEVIARSGIGRMKVMPWLLSEEPDWWQRVAAGWHHIGTTRMAADSAHGVVDPDGRVFDVDNLFVAGSSVFPTSSYINPTLTLVALTIRLADHLKARASAGGVAAPRRAPPPSQ
jgi:choline dehydrogenase-like flavoprotein